MHPIVVVVRCRTSSLPTTVAGAVIHSERTVRESLAPWISIQTYWLGQVNRESFGLNLFKAHKIALHTSSWLLHPHWLLEETSWALAKPIGLFPNSPYVFSVHPLETFEMMMGSHAAHPYSLFHTPPSFLEYFPMHQKLFWALLIFSILGFN